MSSYYNHGFDDRAEDPEAEEKTEELSRLGDELLAGRTDRQKEIAGKIYEQLKAGSDVDDIKHLIADLSRTASQDARIRDADRRAGGAR